MEKSIDNELDPLMVAAIRDCTADCDGRIAAAVEAERARIRERLRQHGGFGVKHLSHFQQATVWECDCTHELAAENPMESWLDHALGDEKETR